MISLQDIELLEKKIKAKIYHEAGIQQNMSVVNKRNMSVIYPENLNGNYYP